ncbi:MAG: HEPN domain-containing protein [bacterium]
MILTAKDRESLIKYKIDRSLDALNSAERNLKENDLFTAVQRTYYASYYSAEALLLTKGLSFSSHKSSIGSFNKEFVYTGLVDKKYSSILKELFETRQTGDYGNFVGFQREEVENNLNMAKEFIKRINKLTLKILSETK